MSGKARAQVLEMLASGDITVEQADQLLDALEDETPAPSETAPEGERTERVQKRFVKRERVGRNPDFDQLIGLAIHGVSPGFIRDLRSAGLEDLTTDEVVEMAIHGVEPGYVRKVRSLGWKVKPSEIVQLAIHGIEASYLERIKDLDVDLDIDQVVQLGIHGVDPEVVIEWSQLQDDERPGRRVRVETVERRPPVPRPPQPGRPAPPAPPAPPARPAAPAAPAQPAPPAPPGRPVAREAAPEPEFHQEVTPTEDAPPAEEI